jgi:hypothetical protein
MGRAAARDGGGMNAFLNIADTQMASPVKAKHRARDAREDKAPMVPTPTEKKLREQQKLLTVWRAWHREMEAELLTGPYGKDIKGLQTFIRTMPLSSAGALIKLIQGARWLRGADAATRQGVLWIVARGIQRLRERNGLDPFDDALPGEPPTAFEEIREMLK